MGEYIAEHFLRGRGARVIGRNIHTPLAEIDLVVQLDRVRFAVEVKSSRSSRAGDPLEALTDSQLRRIRNACRVLQPPVTRVDAIGVVIGDDVRVRWVQRVG